MYMSFCILYSVLYVVSFMCMSFAAAGIVTSSAGISPSIPLVLAAAGIAWVWRGRREGPPLPPPHTLHCFAAEGVHMGMGWGRVKVNSLCPLTPSPPLSGTK
jgi:hypothetical protein